VAWDTDVRDVPLLGSVPLVVITEFSVGDTGDIAVAVPVEDSETLVVTNTAVVTLLG